MIDELIVGASSPCKELKRLIKMVAKVNTTVLVLGETGTGKELVAKALHNESGRKGLLISVNCAAIPSELLESELFGHEKGSFTGADKPRAGRFEQAAGGTLFLDEIGDMPISLQSKLLRALEDKSIQRVGGNKTIKVDFRLVCATHQDLSLKVDKGDFRADLFYRINVFPIDVPRLSDRAVDIPLILTKILEDFEHFSEPSNSVNSVPTFDDTALKALQKYSWPGNVRELKNLIERACVLFNGRSINGEHVKNNLLKIKAPEYSEESSALWDAAADLVGIPADQDDTSVDLPLPHPNHYKDWFSYFDNIDLRRHLQDIEIVLIEAALENSAGQVSQASGMLKLRRTTLIEKMKKLAIEKPFA
jgi:sigma-54 specific flagellar transcriptional regulator A